MHVHGIYLKRILKGIGIFHKKLWLWICSYVYVYFGHTFLYMESINLHDTQLEI